MRRTIVTNSIKYAFPDNRAGVITIILKKNDIEAALEVHDNGIGLLGDFDLSKIETMGMFLVQALINQINGAITIESDHGTYARIKFPLE